MNPSRRGSTERSQSPRDFPLSRTSATTPNPTPTKASNLSSRPTRAPAHSVTAATYKVQPHYYRRPLPTIPFNVTASKVEQNAPKSASPRLMKGDEENKESHPLAATYQPRVSGSSHADKDFTSLKVASRTIPKKSSPDIDRSVLMTSLTNSLSSTTSSSSPLSSSSSTSTSPRGSEERSDKDTSRRLPISALVRSVSSSRLDTPKRAFQVNSSSRDETSISSLNVSATFTSSSAPTINSSTSTVATNTNTNMNTTTNTNTNTNTTVASFTLSPPEKSDAERKREKQLQRLYQIYKTHEDKVKQIDLSQYPLPKIIRLQNFFRKIHAKRTLKALKEQYNLRTNLVKELLSTEQFYLKCLTTLHKVFFLPLRETAIKNPQFSFISYDDVRIIFAGVEVLYNVNTEFAKKLEERVSKWSPHQKIGQVFLSIVPFLKVYTGYVNNYNQAMATLEECKKNAQFKEFLNTTKNLPGVEHDLPSYLIMPIQRIPRYQLLLEQLLKATPLEHPDRADLASALQQIVAVADYMNERKRDVENLLKVTNLQSNLVYKNGVNFVPIVTPVRRYRREGLFEVFIRNERSPYNYLFLFTDALLFTKQKQKKKGCYLFHELLLLKNLEFGIGSKEEKPAISVFCEGTEPILIVFPTQDERDQWMADLTNKSTENSNLKIATQPLELPAQKDTKSPSGLNSSEGQNQNDSTSNSTSSSLSSNANVTVPTPLALTIGASRNSKESLTTRAIISPRNEERDSQIKTDDRTKRSSRVRTRESTKKDDRTSSAMGTMKEKKNFRERFFSMVAFFRSKDDASLEEMLGDRKLEKKLGLHRKKQTPDVNVDAIKNVANILNQSQAPTLKKPDEKKDEKPKN
jgi:hypothetical protein